MKWETTGDLIDKRYNHLLVMADASTKTTLGSRQVPLVVGGSNYETIEIMEGEKWSRYDVLVILIP